MVAKAPDRTGEKTLRGRTLYVPQMAYAGARLAAAAFRSVGVDATVAPSSDAETLELGGEHASGEECLPHKVTLGDFLKVCRAPGFDPSKTAFLMVTAHGPCRFGQYAPYLENVLAESGWGDVLVFSPTSKNGYRDLGDKSTEVLRATWMGVVVGDLAQKFLLKTRPYETQPGASDAVFEQAVTDLEAVVATQGLTPKERLARLVAQVERMRDRFRAVPADYVRGRPLIGLVGEIFCRLNSFSNDNVDRRIEKLGGECWLSDIAEWVWYTDWEQQSRMVRQRGRFNTDFLKIKLKTHVQHGDEQALYAPVRDDIAGYEEPQHVRDVLALSEPYLPPEGCLGEMVLSAGKTIYLHGKGADGIVDISPFTCMNGIICEAVYPKISSDHDDLPIRMCYYDGVNTDVERDLEIFLDLARSYQRRKTETRVYPAYFA